MGEDMTSALRPTPIPAFEGVDIIGVAAGGLHSIAISSDGQVTQSELFLIIYLPSFVLYRYSRGVAMTKRP